MLTLLTIELLPEVEEMARKLERGSPLNTIICTFELEVAFRNIIYRSNFRFHVLVVEDSPFQRKMICRRMVDVGAQIFMHIVLSNDKAIKWMILNSADRNIGSRLYPIFSEICRDSFQSCFRIVQASNGDDVVANALGSDSRDLHRFSSGNCFNLIIVDQVLGYDSGHIQGDDIIKSLRKCVEFDNSIIIGCSANLANHGVKMLRAGANFTWEKPIPNVNDIISQLLIGKFQLS